MDKEQHPEKHVQERESEKAADLEALADALAAFRQLHRDLDQWERVHLARGLAAVSSGCYGIGAIEAELALTPEIERTPRTKLPTDPFYERLDLAIFERALDEIWAEPARRVPYFGRIEVPRPRRRRTSLYRQSCFNNPCTRGRSHRNLGYWHAKGNKRQRLFEDPRCGRPTYPPILDHLVAAERAIAGIATVARLLPRPDSITRRLERREAGLSSQIEGTRTSPTDHREYEATGSGEGLPDDATMTLAYTGAKAGQDIHPVLQEIVFHLGLIHHDQLVPGSGHRRFEAFGTEAGEAVTVPMTIT